MARNLREKIALIVNDAYDLRQVAVITKLENLFKEELALKDEDRVLTYHDLFTIKSSATQNYTNMNMSTAGLGEKLANDRELVRTLCMIDAVVGFMRLKKLINFKFEYEKK